MQSIVTLQYPKRREDVVCDVLTDGDENHGTWDLTEGTLRYHSVLKSLQDAASEFDITYEGSETAPLIVRSDESALIRRHRTKIITTLYMENVLRNTKEATRDSRNDGTPLNDV